MIDFDEVRVIRDEDEYNAALVAVRPYFNKEPDPDTEDGARFEGLCLLIENYEAKVYPIPVASPLEVLRFCMEQNGRSQADLAKLFDSRPRASEILSGRRELTLEQVRRLHREWHIPVAALIADLHEHRETSSEPLAEYA